MEILSSFQAYNTEKKVLNKIPGQVIDIFNNNKLNTHILSDVSYSKPYYISTSSVNYGNQWTFNVPNNTGFLRPYFVVKIDHTLSIQTANADQNVGLSQTFAYDLIKELEIKVSDSSKVYRYNKDDLKLHMIADMNIDMKNSMFSYDTGLCGGKSPGALTTAAPQNKEIYVILPLPSFSGYYPKNKDAVIKNDLYPAHYLQTTEIKLRFESDKKVGLESTATNLANLTSTINSLEACFWGYESDMSMEKNFVLNTPLYECQSNNGLNVSSYKVSNAGSLNISLDGFKSEFPVDHIVVGVQDTVSGETLYDAKGTKHKYKKNINIELLDGNKKLNEKLDRSLDVFNMIENSDLGELSSDTTARNIASGFDSLYKITFSERDYNKKNMGYLNNSNSLTLKLSGSGLEQHDTVVVMFVYQNVMRIEKSVDEKAVAKILG